MRANLWLRTASRVLVRVANFKATAFFELEKRAKRIPWDEFLAPGVQPEFRVTARKSKLYHSDAIAERLQEAAGAGPRSLKIETANPNAQSPQLFIVRVQSDVFTISADTSGDLLHMRGYRQAVAKAPLRETLAAGLLLASGWTGDTPLLDPFCGSGTIPIEAALIARHFAPGLHRRFAFMDWPKFDVAQWRGLTDEAKATAVARSSVRILGSDRDAGAIESASANARRADVAGDVEFSARAISAIDPPATPGLIATNPPYGVRVGSRSDLRNLYAQLGHVLASRAPGWRIAMYSADTRLPLHTGIQLKEALRTSNGGIGVSVLVGTVEGATT
jgi:putative N6-adenine-specific DNA methylase